MEIPWPLIIGISIAAVTGLVTARILRRFWPKTGHWGINPTRPVCHHCQTPAPQIRKPANRRQFLWGGWTCPRCGHELDKYGHPIATPPDGQ